MKNYGLSPVAQPQSYGTAIKPSSIHIPTPVSQAPIRTGQANSPIPEFAYLSRKHQKAAFQPQLEALMSMPALTWKERSGKEWTRFAQEITNQAVFIQASEAGSIHIRDRNFYSENLSVSLETASTLCYFTKLYYVLGQLGRVDIAFELDGEFRKQSSVGGNSGINFIYALQGFLPRADIELWHKQHINNWINARLPESDWLPMAELYPTMQVFSTQTAIHSVTAEPRQQKVEQLLAGGFEPWQLAELVSAKALSFYDSARKISSAKPGQWASFYWALRAMGYIQKVPSDIVPILIAASFNGKTSKSSVNLIKRNEINPDGCVPIRNTETARICEVINQYLSDK